MLSSLSSVASLTLISRILGYARDLIIALVFGAGNQTDAFFTAFKIPNLFRRLTAEGALTQAFVPILNHINQVEGRDVAHNLFARLSILLFLFTFVLSLVAIFFAEEIILLFAGGFAEQPEKFMLSVDLLQIIFPYIVIISLAAIGSSVLNSFEIFALPAIAPACLNISLCLASLLAAPYFQQPIEALAWGIICGGIAHLMLIIWGMRRISFSFKILHPKLDKSLIKIFKLTLQGALAVGVIQINLLINLRIASELSIGTISWLYLADRLMELPTGVIGAALAVIVLPALSRQRNTPYFSKTLDTALRLIILLGLPISAFLYLFAEPIVKCLFEYGQFTTSDSKNVALALSSYAPFIVALIALRILQSGFFAQHDMKTPLLFALLSIISTQVANAVLILGFGWQHDALTASIGFAALVSCIGLLVVLKYKKTYQPQVGWLLFLIKIIIATVCVCVVAWQLSGPLDNFFNQPIIGLWAALIINLSICTVLYLLILRLSGIRASMFSSKSNNSNI